MLMGENIPHMYHSVRKFDGYLGIDMIIKHHICLLYTSDAADE